MKLTKKYTLQEKQLTVILKALEQYKVVASNKDERKIAETSAKEMRECAGWRAGTFHKNPNDDYPSDRPEDRMQQWKDRMNNPAECKSGVCD